jgi:hypothetical protein
MSRSLVFTTIFALALQSQAQLFSHGAPASVTSPTPDGRQHGVPASVLSPTPLPFGVNPPPRPGIRLQGPLRRFGNGRRQHLVGVPIPLFYSYYTDGYPSVADPYVPETPSDPAPAQQASANDRNDEELRAAYLQGARDALRQEESRYSERFMDSRERASREAPAPEPRTSRKSGDEASAPQPVVEDKSPTTVFIFKDGHQLETKNYAIMGQTLFDFSGKTLKKIQMEEIDATATAKANDDRGVQVKLQ